MPGNTDGSTVHSSVFQRQFHYFRLSEGKPAYSLLHHPQYEDRVPSERDEELATKFRLRGPLSKDNVHLVDIIRKTYIHPPSSEPYNFSELHELSYRKEQKGDSWASIDYFLKVLFSDEPPGFFVEAGALDGEFLSNTLWLEQSKKWKGLLVEPETRNFEHLRHKHRRAWITNSCLSNRDYPMEKVFVSEALRYDRLILDGGEPWNYRGSSHELGINIVPVDSPFFKLSERSYSLVQCFPLDTLLLATNTSTVDFLSLDIQGSEKEVLRGLSFNSTRIRVIVVEVVEEELDHNFIKFMEENGYEIVNRGLIPRFQDHLYIRRDEVSLLDKIKDIRLSWK